VGAAAILAIPSCGQSLVMISGNFGIDLSVGQVMSLTAVAGYMVLGSGQSFLPIAVLVVLGIGGCIGAVNGSLVALVRLPALVVTLGTLVVAQGIVLVLASKGTPAGSVPPILDDMTTRSIGGIKWVTILAAVFVGGMVVFTKRSRFGRMLFLVGSNREAARLSGLRVRRIVIITFVLAGMCSGFAGLLLLSYAGTANLDLGSEYLVLSIAATVIGGTSLAGGEGSLIGAATGAIAFEVINALMLTLGASTAVRQMVVGGLLMLLLTFNARTPRLRQ
jgi:ribose transport system permease protein